MAENKIKLSKVAEYLEEHKFEFETVLAENKPNVIKIDKKKFEYNMFLNYRDSRILINSILGLIDNDEFITYSMKEAYTLLMVFKTCTNIDMEIYETDLDELAHLPYNKDAQLVYSFLKELDDYDYIASLLQEVDMRISQRQQQINRAKPTDRMLEEFVNYLTSAMNEVKVEDFSSILNVVNKLASVDQKDIVKHVATKLKNEEL